MFSKILLVPFFLIGIILQPLCAQTISPDSAVADELIPIGYTTQKNSHLTGAIVSVKGELINRRPVIQVSQALQGLAGGI